MGLNVGKSRGVEKTVLRKARRNGKVDWKIYLNDVGGRPRQLPKSLK
jgi:hypothetical protein